MLCEMIACVNSQYSTVTKSALGKICCAITDKERQHIDLYVIESLLANTIDPVVSAMRAQILVVCRKLPT